MKGVLNLKNSNFVFPKQLIEENPDLRKKLAQITNNMFGRMVFSNIDDAYTALKDGETILGIDFEIIDDRGAIRLNTAYKFFNDKMIAMYTIYPNSTKLPFIAEYSTVLCYFGEDKDEEFKKILDSKHHFFILGEGIVKTEAIK